MRDMRKVLVVAALGATAALGAPAIAWAAPAHAAASATGFTGIGTGRNGSFALSAARANARSQISRAGIPLDFCFESSNDVEFNDFDNIWGATSTWVCNN